eukprot:m51a1_g9397 hypothetical protein (916) ;mRNA; f:275291-280987
MEQNAAVPTDPAPQTTAADAPMAAPAEPSVAPAASACPSAGVKRASSGPVVLGGRPFGTRDDLRDFCRGLGRSKYADEIAKGAGPVALDDGDRSVLEDVLRKGHHDPASKIGPGIDAILVGMHPSYADTKCFFKCADGLFGSLPARPEKRVRTMEPVAEQSIPHVDPASILRFTLGIATVPQTDEAEAEAPKESEGEPAKEAEAAAEAPKEAETEAEPAKEAEPEHKDEEAHEEEHHAEDEHAEATEEHEDGAHAAEEQQQQQQSQHHHAAPLLQGLTKDQKDGMLQGLRMVFASAAGESERVFVGLQGDGSRCFVVYSSPAAATRALDTFSRPGAISTELEGDGLKASISNVAAAEAAEATAFMAGKELLGAALNGTDISIAAAAATASTTHASRFHYPRQSDLKWNNESVSFRSRNPSTGDRVELDLRSTPHSPMRFRMRFYETDKSDADLDTRVSFTSIVEFEERSLTFDGWNTSDMQVRRVPIGRIGWAPITAPEVADVGGVKVTTFTVTYNAAGALLVLRLMLADNPYSVGGSSYEPSQVKIDVELRNWTYSGNNSHIALACAVQSPKPFVHDQPGGAEEPESVHVSEGDVLMTLGWNRTAEVDGKPVAVLASTFEDTMPVSESDDGNADLKWDRESVSFTSRNPSTGDRVGLDLRSRGHSPMRFRLWYFPTAKSEVSLSSHVVFKSIVEFEERSLTFDGWNASDVQVRRVPIESTGWSPITAPSVTTIGGVKVTTFAVTYNAAGALLVLRLMLADNPYSVGGTSYDPSQVKIDVELHNWTYSGNSSYLALACAVQSPKPFSHGPERVHIFENDVSVTFGWNRTVVADGKTVAVIASTFEDTEPDSESGDAAGSSGQSEARGQYAQLTHFAFDAVQPRDLVWDPYLGVSQAALHSLAALSSAAVLLSSLM